MSEAWPGLCSPRMAHVILLFPQIPHAPYLNGIAIRGYIIVYLPQIFSRHF